MAASSETRPLARLFDDLVRVFRRAEFKHGLLLVDDFERIVVHQSARERLSFVEDVRYYFIEGRSRYAVPVVATLGARELTS